MPLANPVVKRMWKLNSISQDYRDTAKTRDGSRPPSLCAQPVDFP